MKERSLIGGAVLATILTLMSVGVASAQPLQPGSLLPAAPTAAFLVVSDLVDLEWAVKAGNAEEREKVLASHAVQVQVLAPGAPGR
jgi:hypothetical protein